MPVAGRAARAARARRRSPTCSTTPRTTASRRAAWSRWTTCLLRDLRQHAADRPPRHRPRLAEAPPRTPHRPGARRDDTGYRGHRLRPGLEPVLRPDRGAAARRRATWPKVHEYDARPRLRLRAPGSTSRSPARNKGLEGLSCVRRDGKTYLLGLCEGNRCRGGAAGRRPGGGRIQVFAARAARVGARRHDQAAARRCGSRTTAAWRSTATGCASCRRRPRRCGSAGCAPSAWEVVDDGTRVRVPHATRDGRSCLLQRRGRVLAVGDRGRGGLRQGRSRTAQHARCRAKDQSIHVFAIPPGAR